jgi:hypothetical protein
MAGFPCAVHTILEQTFLDMDGDYLAKDQPRFSPDASSQLRPTPLQVRVVRQSS